MKKFLLFVVAAVFAANMNAQTLPAKKVAKSAEVSLTQLNAKVNKKFVAAKPAAKAEALNADVKAPSMKFAAKAPKKAAASAKDIAGDYIYDLLDDETGLVRGLNVPFDEVTVTINGVEYPGIHLQANFAGYNNGCDAIYDAETNTVVVPAGTFTTPLELNDGTPVDGCVFAIYKDGDSWDLETVEIEGEEYYAPIVFDIEEHENGGYGLVLQNEGWAILGVDPETEDLVGTLTHSFDDEAINQVNATASYSMVQPTGGKWGEWEDFEDGVYVENYGSFATIHGLLGGLINLDVDLDEEEGTVTVGNMAVVDIIPVQGVDKTFYFCIIENHEVSQDESTTATGVYDASTGYILFGTPISETQYQPIGFAICSDLDAQGMGYFLAQISGLEIIPNSLIDDAIKTIDVTSNNNMIYNIAGQRVSDSYKGVAIKNGKKFIK